MEKKYTVIDTRAIIAAAQRQRHEELAGLCSAGWNALKRFALHGAHSLRRPAAPRIRLAGK